MADSAAVFGEEAGATVSIGGRLGVCAGGVVYSIRLATGVKVGNAGGACCVRECGRAIPKETGATGMAGDCGVIAWDVGIRMGVHYAPAPNRRFAGDEVLHPA